MTTTATQTPPHAAGEVDRIEVDTRADERIWYLFAVSGVVSAAIGILVLAYPDPSVKLLGVFLGIDLLAAGVVLIVRATSNAADDDSSGAILLGVLALIAGLIVIRNPGKSLALLTIAFAVYLVVAGALSLGHAITRRERRGLAVVRGLVLVSAGTVIIAWPDVSVKTLVVLTGIALLLQGAMEIAEAFALRSLSRAARAS